MQSLLSPFVVYYCIKTLFLKSNERSIEYVCNILVIAGTELHQKVFLFLNSFNNIYYNYYYLSIADKFVGCF